MFKNYFFGVCFILFLPFCQIFSQIVTFQKIYTGAGREAGQHIIPDSSGYLISGYASANSGDLDACLTQIDSAGNVLWQHTYGGSGDDQFSLVVPANDGGFLAFGDTRSQGQGGQDVLVVKTDALGNPQWSKTFGGSGDDRGPVQDEILRFPDGYLISGQEYSYGGNGESASYFIRLDNNGNVVWERSFGSTSYNVVVGSYIVDDTIFAGGSINTDGCIIKLNANTGEVLSRVRYPQGYNDALYNIRPTQDGNLLLSDGTWSADNGAKMRQWLLKARPDGEVIWSKVYGKPGINLRGIANNALDGGFILAPFTAGNDPASSANLVKVNGEGDIEWAYQYNGTRQSQFWSAIQTSDGGFLAVGSIQQPDGSGNSDLFIVKTDAQGWVQGCNSQVFGIQAENFPSVPAAADFSPDVFPPGVAWNVPSQASEPSSADYCANPTPVVVIDTTIVLCPNHSITIAGNVYYAPAVVNDTLSVDSIIRYTLNAGAEIIYSDSFLLCPNASITIHGTVYTQPGIVVDTIPSTSGGCDTIATYTILRVDNPKLQQLVSFCSGDSVVINGVTYTQADTAISYMIPASVGCDTLVEVFLSYSSPPSVTRTVAFCSGDSVVIDGIAYFQPGTVTGIIPAATGCDTLATYVLEFLPQPMVTKTLAFCSGDSVVIDGIAYFQPGPVTGIIPAVTGCDTLATYVLEFLPQPTVTKTIAFCPGASVSIEGVTYTQPGTVSGVIAATSGCDTLVTYTLQFAPQPTRSQTIEFCNGNSVTIGGTVYTQPGTVLDTVVSTTGGCDTLVTYTLQHPVPSHPTAITLNCPNDLFVDADPGQASVPVVYAVPVATSDCPCPGVALNLQQGLVSGSNFPLGMTDVCYHAKDSCGNAITCCFNVTVEEKPACDVKEINCIKFELLGITADAQQRKTYRIRTTNNCTNRLLYLAIQVPDGIVADQPLNNATYTAASGRTYLVRNPNFSPFYSVRFSSVGDSIHNGESDVFQYTLPAQADPDYIHVTVRLEPGIFYEAHLNTFSCPIEYEPNNRLQQRSAGSGALNLFPNPTDGALFADLSAWAGQQVQIRIFNAQGRLIQSMPLLAEGPSQPLELSASLPNGIYFLEMTPPQGPARKQGFVVEH